METMIIGIKFASLPNFISVCATFVEIMNGNCWLWTDIPTAAKQYAPPPLSHNYDNSTKFPIKKTEMAEAK